MTMNLYPVKAKVDGIVVRNLRLQANQAGTVVWQFDRDTGDVSEFVRIDAQPERGYDPVIPCGRRRVRSSARLRVQPSHVHLGPARALRIRTWR